VISTGGANVFPQSVDFTIITAFGVLPESNCRNVT
jgi:hypothetical protein